MTKTPDYIKSAVANYQKTKERVNILLDKGTKERIKNKYGNDFSINGYIKRLIDADLSGTDAGNIDENDDDFPFRRE